MKLEETGKSVSSFLRETRIRPGVSLGLGDTYLSEKIVVDRTIRNRTKTDTGGWVEKTKAIGRKMVKELGKLTGRKLCKMPCPGVVVGATTKEYTATVYQKHRSMPTRKGKYMG